MEFFDPEHRGGEQQVARGHLAVIEHARPPFLVLHLERVGVFVQIRAVKLDQPASILGEMRRHPVHDDADAGLVRLVDQVHQILGRTVAACRREIADDLIPPRTVERVFGQGHEFDMGIAHFLDIGYQLVRKPAVGIEVPVLMQLPGAEMAFVNIHRTGVGQMAFAPFHPGGVAPFVALDVEHLGGVARAGFGVEAVGIGFIEHIARFCPYAILICGIFRNMRDKFFPDALLVPLHVIHFTVPAVEFAHDRNLFGLRRVNTEQVSWFAVLHQRVRAHIVIRAAVSSRIEELTPLPAGRRCAFLLHIASSPSYKPLKQAFFHFFTIFCLFRLFFRSKPGFSWI